MKMHFMRASRTYATKAKERGKAFSTEKTVKAVEEMLLNL